VIYELFFDEDRKCFEIKASGKASVEGFLALDTELVEHHKWKPGTNVLYDLRDSDFRDLSRLDVERRARYTQSLGEKIGKARLACVMNQNLDYGIARMWEIITMMGDVPFEIRVFRSIAEAVEWLHS